MAIVNTHYGFCAKGGAAVKFTYTGEYNVRDDGVVELLTSGTIVFLEPKVIDVFMVGGGGCGSGSKNASRGVGGGGGGYTRTIRNLTVIENTSIPVTIGAGAVNYSTAGSSSFNNLTVKGGNNGGNPNGGAGGSGGGGGVAVNSEYGAGGSNGANGETGFIVSPGGKNSVGGSGQGFTTREFGESTGKLYAGGGGGGRFMTSGTPIISMGGTGGGGSGSWVNLNITNSQAPTAGVANTGGGGGGGCGDSNYNEIPGAPGGSGIVCFRVAQELPELAGTWVLNERLYAPENQVSYTGSYTLNGSANKTQMVVNSSYLIDYIGAQAYQDYNFSTNTWRTTNFNRTLIFPEGATATEEYKKWLASNATKQS